jgi:hypothetical protein
VDYNAGRQAIPSPGEIGLKSAWVFNAPFWVINEAQEHLVVRMRPVLRDINRELLAYLLASKPSRVHLTSTTTSSFLSKKSILELPPT